MLKKLFSLFLILIIISSLMLNAYGVEIEKEEIEQEENVSPQGNGSSVPSYSTGGIFDGNSGIDNPFYTYAFVYTNDGTIADALRRISEFDEANDRFDIIVSNPPYIPSDVIEELEPEVRDFEPRSALDGTADGLFFYEILARECGKFLNENGTVYFEIGHDQGEAVKHLLDVNGFMNTRVIKDLAGQDRVVCGRWQTK